MKNDNVGIIYISHRIEEIFNICDRATILKDGEYVDTVDIKDTDEEHLIAMMVGRNVEDMYGIEHAAPGDVALKVENLSSIGKFKDINFEVRKGQIFGMFGLVGSGRTEIVRSVFGADPFDTGKFLSTEKKFTSIRQSMQFSTAWHSFRKNAKPRDSQ